MERLSEIEARVASFTQLQDVIGVMRSLAATRVQQAQNSLAAIRTYSDTIGAAIAEAESGLGRDARHGATGGPALRGVILFCGEHGFCGAFNERLLEAVADSLQGAELYIVGSRGAL